MFRTNRLMITVFIISNPLAHWPLWLTAQFDSIKVYNFNRPFYGIKGHKMRILRAKSNLFPSMDFFLCFDFDFNRFAFNVNAMTALIEIFNVLDRLSLLTTWKCRLCSADSNIDSLHSLVFLICFFNEIRNTFTLNIQFY